MWLEAVGVVVAVLTETGVVEILVVLVQLQMVTEREILVGAAVVLVEMLKMALAAVGVVMEVLELAAAVEAGETEILMLLVQLRMVPKQEMQDGEAVVVETLKMGVTVVGEVEILKVGVTAVGEVEILKKKGVAAVGEVGEVLVVAGEIKMRVLLVPDRMVPNWEIQAGEATRMQGVGEDNFLLLTSVSLSYPIESINIILC